MTKLRKTISILLIMVRICVVVTINVKVMYFIYCICVCSAADCFSYNILNYPIRQMKLCFFAVTSKYRTKLFFLFMR